MDLVILSECFESASLVLQLKEIEGQSVKVHIGNKDYHKILNGIIDKEDNYIQFLGKGNIFITDNAEYGKFADELKKRGELVFGGSAESDRWENERAYGQEIMRKAGVTTLFSINFKGHESFDKAISFIEKNKTTWCIKQNGLASKSLSKVGKFEDGIDIIDKLDDLKHMWAEGEEIDFDLQKKVKGHEMGVSVWFNGTDFVRDKNGEIVWELNWENKKMDGDTGTTTGETATLAYRGTKNSRLAKEMVKMKPFLQKIKYIGNTDINFIISTGDDPKWGIKKDVAYGLEFSNRFGYPFLGVQQEMMKSRFTDLIEGCVKGKNNFLEYNPRWAVVLVLQVPPFPFHSVTEDENAKGQRIYFLENGKWTGKDMLTKEKLRHIQPYEMKYDKEDKEFICTGDEGYLLTVTGQNQNDFNDWKAGIKDANERAMNVIKQNIETDRMHYRKDIGTSPRLLSAVEYGFKYGWI